LQEFLGSIGRIGAQTSRLTKDLLFGIPYAGPYLSLVVLAAIGVLRWLDVPPLSDAERRQPGRPLGQIVKQPMLIIAVL